MIVVADTKLMMPQAIRPDFALVFGRLATESGALPIDIDGIARIGSGAPPVVAPPPLIAIDGRKRPDGEQRPAEHRARGFESDMGLLHDLLDMHPGSFLREFNLSSTSLEWASREDPLRDLASMREILRSPEASSKALVYFDSAFRQLVARFSTASSRRLENFIGIARHEDARPSRVPPPPDRPSVEKPSYQEYAMHRFLKGALLARAGTEVQSLKAERIFIESAELFAKADRFSAAAMMAELARDVQARNGRPDERNRQDEAGYWLEALRLLSDPSFDLLYGRALNAAQGESAGSEALRGIFRSSMAYFRDAGNGDELNRSLVRHAWARLTKAENPSTPLQGFDWLSVRDDMTVVGHRFREGGMTGLAGDAELLAKMALGFAEEVAVAERQRRSSNPPA